MPEAWSDLLAGLTLLAKHPSDNLSPLNCADDILYVMADPAQFTAEEIAQLDVCGFYPDEEADVFYSYRFGSA